MKVSVDMTFRIVLLLVTISFQPVQARAVEDAPESHEPGHEKSIHSLNWLDWSGGEDGESLPLAYMFLNFAAVVVLVYLILRKSLGQKVRTRKEELEKALREADEMRTQAEELMARAKERADEVDLEMARIRKELLQSGEARGRRMEQEARQRAETIRNDSSSLIQQEIDRLSEEIRQEVVDEIVEIAKKRIVEKMTSQDQERMAENFLKSAEKKMDA